jgi:cytochrome c biogenesis protein CcmG/thiol:disulfide interchange protein DsbE
MERKNKYNGISGNTLPVKKIKTGRQVFYAVSSIVILSILMLFIFMGCLADLPIKLNDKPDGSQVGTSESETTRDTGTESASNTETAKDSSTTETEKAYANDFTLLDLEGNEVSLHDFEGKIVVLNFWATWCPPCRAEIPDFVDTYNAYKDKGIQFLGVSDDDVKSLNDFTKEYKINYPTLIDGSKDTIMGKWGITAIPTTFVLNGNGEVFFNQVGMMTKDMLTKAIDAALQAESGQ